MEDHQIVELADDYLKEWYALYAEAVRSGFEVSDEEVSAYLEELKRTVGEAENPEKYKKSWEKEFEALKKRLVKAQNYRRY